MGGREGERGGREGGRKVIMYIHCVYVYPALQAKMDRRLEAEQKKRAKFRTEVHHITCMSYRTSCTFT